MSDSKQVDVLYDMRMCAAFLGALKREPEALRLLDAHDLVAELIESARGVTWFDWCDNDDDAVRAVERLRAALAACAPAKGDAP